MKVLKADRDVALALTGQSSIADVDRSALYQALSPVAHSYPGTKALRSSSQR